MKLPPPRRDKVGQRRRWQIPQKYDVFLVTTHCHSLQIITILIQLILVVPIIGLPIIPLLGGSEAWNQRAVIFFVVFLCLLTFIALLPTGAENPGYLETFVRYLIRHF